MKCLSTECCFNVTMFNIDLELSGCSKNLGTRNLLLGHYLYSKIYFLFAKLRLGYPDGKREAFMFWEEAEGSGLSVLLQTWQWRAVLAKLCFCGILCVCVQ